MIWTELGGYETMGVWEIEWGVERGESGLGE